MKDPTTASGDSPGKSTMTPVAGATWLGVPNIIMLRYGENPKPPFNQYAEAFGDVKRVMWSVTGDGGTTSARRTGSRPCAGGEHAQHHRRLHG